MASTHRTTAGAQRVIITGASSGIGRELAIAYARRGARMVLVARREDLLNDTAAGATAVGGAARCLVADVTAPETAARAVRIAIEHYGGVDVVVINAGRGGAAHARAFNAQEAIAVMDTNTNAAFRMIEAVMPVMLDQGHGVLAAITSLAAYRGMPGSGPYNASKAALCVMMESLRTELRGSGISVVTIAPGFIRSEMTARNNFHMPMMLETDKAAHRIVHAIDRRRSLYRFPWSTSLAVRLLQILPNPIYDRLIRWATGTAAKRM